VLVWSENQVVQWNLTLFQSIYNKQAREEKKKGGTEVAKESKERDSYWVINLDKSSFTSALEFCYDVTTARLSNLVIGSRSGGLLVFSSFPWK